MRDYGSLFTRAVFRSHARPLRHLFQHSDKNGLHGEPGRGGVCDEPTLSSVYPPVFVGPTAFAPPFDLSLRLTADG